MGAGVTLQLGDHEITLAFVLVLVLGWVVGVMCCVVIVKYLQCMTGKSLVFGPRCRGTQQGENHDGLVNPAYELKEPDGQGREKPKVQCKEPWNIQSNSQPFHEYTDVVETSAEVTKSGRLFKWAPSSSQRSAMMSSSMPSQPKTALQHGAGQPGRKTNAYSELDKKMSYQILEPHIQEKSFSFKDAGVKQNRNYNVLDY